MNQVLIGVDVGKTGCRVAVRIDGEAHPPILSRGVVATPGSSGVRRAASALGGAIGDAAAAVGHVQGDGTSIAIGMAGVTTLRGGSEALAEAVAGRWPGATVAVTTDSVTAHAGALDGDPGVVLAVGTGTVALGLAAGGMLHQVDGWGQWLGDDGSGTWIGREAMRAAARARDGRGPATALLAAVEERLAPLKELPAKLAFDAGLPTLTASFVPDVIDVARDDEVAADILARAGAAWAESTLAAADAVGAVRASCVGGLAEVAEMRDAWRSEVAQHLDVVVARGSALDGALLLAQRTDLAHESQVSRRSRPQGGSDIGENLDVLETEGVREGLDDLDERSTDEIVDVVLGAEQNLPHVLAGARDALVEAVALAERVVEAGGRIVYVGAGTPGRLAALDAAECPPTFGVSPDQFIAVLAGGADASATAVEGAEDRAADAAQALADRDVGPNDLVVGIAASGRTPFVLAALQAARAAGASTVAIVNNPGSPIADSADVAIELLTGAEVISGSTRLTAGTAQKVTLNTLSTATMVRAGKTYGPLMVDVVASNHKLRRRACRIVREVGDVDDATARATLEAAGWRTKTAIVALLAGVDVDDADARLAIGHGRVRAAVETTT